MVVLRGMILSQGIRVGERSRAWDTRPLSRLDRARGPELPSSRGYAVTRRRDKSPKETSTLQHDLSRDHSFAACAQGSSKVSKLPCSRRFPGKLVCGKRLR